MESLRAKHDALAERLVAAAPSEQQRLRMEQAGILAEMERLSDEAPPGVGDHIRRAAESRVAEINAVRERLAAGESVALPDDLTLPAHAPWEPPAAPLQLPDKPSPKADHDAK